MKIPGNGLLRKLYSEFFYVPKYGKIREKVMLTRAFSTLAVIVTCLAAMGFTAYAYFTCNVTSSFGVLQAASFTAQALVTDESTGSAVNPETAEGKVQTFRLTPGLYTVQLSKGNGTSSTGFCKVTVGGNAYYTQQLGADISAENGVRNEITFQLNVLLESVVTIESSWGTSANYATAGSQQIANAQPLQVITADGTTTITENDTSAVVDENTNATTESEPAETIYTVQDGDSLSVIAQTYGVSLERLAEYNEITDPNWIEVGQQIKIPPAD